VDFVGSTAEAGQDRFGFPGFDLKITPVIDLKGRRVGDRYRYWVQNPETKGEGADARDRQHTETPSATSIAECIQRTQ
jgi:hypothetical protein